MLSAAQAVIGWIIRNWPLLVGVMTGPLGIAVVMIIRYWGTIQSVIGSVLNWIKATASAVWGWLVSFTSAVWSAVTSTIIGAATSVRNAVTGAWNNMLAVIRSVQAAITGAITSAFNWVKSAFVGTWTFAQQVTARLWAAIAGVITWWFGRVMNSLTNWFNWIKGAMSAVWGFLQAVTTRAWSGLANTIETGWARVKGATTAALTWIRETMQRAWDMIKGAAGSAWTAIAGAIGTAWDKVKNAVAAPVRWIVRSVINPLVKGINTLITKIGMPAIPTVPGFAEGGRIPGGWGGGDTQLIVAEPGEWVLTKRQAKGMGYGWLRTLPRFADGGMVGGGPSGDGGPSPMLGWPGWANPADWGSAIAGGAVKAWKEVVAAGKGVVDEFSGMLRWAAAEAFKAMTAPLRKGAEAMGKSKQLFPSAYMGKLVVSVIDHAVSFIESKAVPEGSGVGGIAELAQTFNGHRYIWGGGANEKTGFDCSSFINMLAGMTGLPTPGGFKAPSNIHGPVTGDWLGWSGMKTIKLGQIQPGDIAVNSHHIILSIGMKGEGFAARSTATGTGPQRITNAYTVRRWPGPGPGGSGAYMGAFSMGAGLGPIVAGSRSQNLVTIARALMGLGWSATGAAGAAGNIYQESWGDPLAAGTGGRGLIGWTPPGRLPNAAFVPGNPSLSLQRQIPLASQFFKSNMGKYWALAQRQVDPGKSALIIMNMGERPAGSSQSNPFFGGSSTSKGGLRASVARQVFDQLRRMAGKGMARGGILREEIAGIGSSGQLYHLAEGGRPEAIVPLSGSAVEVAASTQPTRSLTINVYPRANQSERDIAAAVSRELAWAQAGGTL